MDKLFLLDAYALIYRAYYGFIKNPRINSKGENTSAILGFVNTLEDVLGRENPQYIGVAFDPSGPTFRHEAYKPYKAQREETPEAIRFAVPIIKDILKAYNIPVIEVKGYEADDVIGTLAKQSQQMEGIQTYMMTPDKDYGQLVAPNVHIYKPRHDGGFDTIGEKEIIDKYGIEKVEQVIDLLGLMGDSADNFPGCPGVGEKTAVKLVNQFGSTENMLEHTDEIKGALRKKVEEHVDDIKMSKFLATIKTDVPVTLDLDSLKREEKNEAELRSIFERLEFRAIIQRLFGTPAENIKPQRPASEKKKESLYVGELFGGATDNNKKSKNASNENDIFSNSFSNDLFSSNLEDIKSFSHNYYLVDNAEEIDNLIARILTSKIVSVDTETTSVDAMDAKLVGMSFSIAEGEAYYVLCRIMMNGKEKTMRQSWLLLINLKASMSRKKYRKWDRTSSMTCWCFPTMACIWLAKCSTP